MLFSINIDDVLKINNKALITNDKRIDLDKIDYIVISPGISPDNHIIEVYGSMSIKIITDMISCNPSQTLNVYV